MASSFEKSVKGATKIKAAPPKTKYIEHILVATHSGEHGIAEVFRSLVLRLREPTWTVVLKGLITVHLMIREGSPDSTLAYLAKHRNILAVNTFSDAQLQGRNIRHYANYLSERARAYKDTKADWVRTKESKLEKLSVEKGLLRETEVVQYQLTALLKCDVMEHDPDNEIIITVFRLLVLDLLALFQVLNQAMINILGHFFEMSKTDAERAMEIYRTFTRQTDYVVQYLSIARQYEHMTRVEVPKLKHAPVNLGRQLDEYLKDPDFEIHRRQYIAEQDAKKRGGSKSAFKSEPSKASSSKPTSSSTPQPPKPAEPAKGPEQDLIDLFDSIEDKQTTMVIHPMGQPMPFTTNSPFQQPQPSGAVPNNGFIAQPTGLPGLQVPNMGPFAQQQPAPQQPLQPAFTGAGFGGFTSQPQPSFSPSSLAPIPQESAISSFQPAPTGLTVPQAAPAQLPMQTGSTNPFRQSMLMAQQTAVMSPPTAQPQVPAPTGKSTNPFARSSPQQAQPFIAPAPSNTSPFSQAQPLSQTQPQGPIPGQPMTSAQPQTSPLQSMQTGTNPFAKGFSGSAASPATSATQIPVTSGAAAPSLAPQAPQATGTNPFRQGAFVNHNTGMGWQHSQSSIGGGLDGLETVPVFPRPAAQTPWQGQ